jgi:hypothetical protein
MALRLEIAEFTDANHWRLRLTDVDGAFLADHPVELDPAEPKYQALFDLPAYLRRFSAPTSGTRMSSVFCMRSASGSAK